MHQSKREKRCTNLGLKRLLEKHMLASPQVVGQDSTRWIVVH
jgi:hypothetical protein